MFSLLLFLFITIPLIEVYLLLNIGAAIGGLNTFIVVIITGVLGAYFTKIQGRHLLYQIQTKVAENQIPEKELVYGVMVFVGGVLLVTPGFLTDFLGLSLVIPVTRNFLAKYIVKHFESKIHMSSSTFGANHQSYTYTSHTDAKSHNRPEMQGDIIDAEYTKKDEDSL